MPVLAVVFTFGSAQLRNAKKVLSFTGSLLVYLVGPARWNRLPKRAVPLFRECRPRVRPTSPALGSVSAFTSLQELAKKRRSSKVRRKRI